MKEITANTSEEIRKGLIGLTMFIDKDSDSLVRVISDYGSSVPSYQQMNEDNSSLFNEYPNLGYFVEDDKTVRQRYSNGDTVEVTKELDIGYVVSFDYEDSKPWLDITVDKYDVDWNPNKADPNIDKIIMTLKMLNADKTLNTDYNGIIKVPILTPRGVIPIKAEIKNGICVRDFTPLYMGEYVYPAFSRKINGYRVNNQFKIDSCFDTKM